MEAHSHTITSNNDLLYVKNIGLLLDLLFIKLVTHCDSNNYICKILHVTGYYLLIIRKFKVKTGFKH